MDKKKLQELANRIKKANEAVKLAIFALGDYQKILDDIDDADDKEDTFQKLAVLLKDFYNERNGFESPCGFYAADFQKFAEDMRILEEAISNLST